MIEPGLSARSVQDALLKQLRSIRNKLEARIQQKLTGEVLQSQSGTLAASIISSVDNDVSNTTIAVSSSGPRYAAIPEFGGKTKAHEIVAVNSKALVFPSGGHLTFAKHVNHPGSTLLARSYLRSSLDEIQKETRPALKRAILDALGQNLSTL